MEKVKEIEKLEEEYFENKKKIEEAEEKIIKLMSWGSIDYYLFYTILVISLEKEQELLLERLRNFYEMS